VVLRDDVPVVLWDDDLVPLRCNAVVPFPLRAQDNRSSDLNGLIDIRFDTVDVWRDGRVREGRVYDREDVGFQD
jgi:hypothetical protein